MQVTTADHRSQPFTAGRRHTRTAADHCRADGQAERILGLLVAAGAAGVTNHDLWAVCHAVNSRISDLRRRGHDIVCTPEGGGRYRYVLRQKHPTLFAGAQA